MSRDKRLKPRVTGRCAECGVEFTLRRSDAVTCSDRCRQRRKRKGDGYVVTEADRAAIRRVFERDGFGHPLAHRLTTEEVTAHVTSTVIRSGEPGDDGSMMATRGAK